MGYSHEKKPKKIYDGTQLMPLSVSKELLVIRPQIEKNHEHAGQQLELVYQAYKKFKRVTDIGRGNLARLVLLAFQK